MTETSLVFTLIASDGQTESKHTVSGVKNDVTEQNAAAFGETLASAYGQTLQKVQKVVKTTSELDIE